MSQSKHYNTIIVGAGISGCAAAWALGKYKLKTLVLEAQDDVACGATKANSGIVHAGYDCVPGTLKARLNVRGAEIFPTLAQDLEIPYKVNGSLVLCFSKDSHSQLEELYQRGQANGVPGLQLLSAKEAYKMEPNLAPGLYSALWAKTAAIVCPYEATIAMAENAAENGVEFLLNTAVTKISKGTGAETLFTIETENGIFTSDTVINAAGVSADSINNFVAKKHEILPQRGEYYLLDKAHSGFVNCTLFPLPGPKGKGILIAPTTHGNIIVGPNAEDISDKADTATTRAGLDEVMQGVGLTVKDLPIWGRITTFSGLRAKHVSKDFVIDQPVPGFINALAIDSPGLSAAPAIGEMLTGMVTEILKPEPKPEYKSKRPAIKRFSHMSFEEQAALIKENPRYGQMVCRCEMVTEAEVIESIRRPVGARNLAAIKRRTRAQMGRCQGGFCSPKLAEILAKELGISEESIWTC